ncbi:MAG: hypothetical protein RRY79_02115, partial [Clostridia bacterium]
RRNPMLPESHTVNAAVKREEKSKAVSVYSIRNFKFLGFALGRNKSRAYIRVHAESIKKAKLKKLTSRNRGRSVRLCYAECVYAGMAWILWNCKYEKHD